MKRKIIWVTHGPNNIYVNLFEALKKKDGDLELIMTASKEWVGKFKNNYFKIKFLHRYEKIFNIIFLPYYIIHYLRGNSTVDIPNLIYFKGLYHFLEKEKPDIVIANLYYRPPTWQAARYCKKTNTPFILQTEIKQLPKGYLAQYALKQSFKILKGLFNQAEWILSWTSEGVKFGKKYFGIKNASKVKCLPAGIDTDIVHKIKIKKENDILRLLIVARMIPFKRYGDLLKAVKYLKDNSKLKFKLSIRGDGPLEETIKERIRELKIQDKIEFIEKTPYNKMNEVFCKHDIFILPSFNEAIGMVVPEAMACGLPVIISDTCGATTYVEDGKNGYIFKTFNYKDLARKILSLKDAKKREEFGKHSEKLIKEKFDVNIVAKEFERLIKEKMRN